MAAPRVPRLELDNERSRRRRSRSASGTHWAATSPAQGLAPHRPALRWPPGAPALLRAAGRRWSCLRPPEASRSPPRSAPAPQTPPRWLRFVDRAWEVPNFETRPASWLRPWRAWASDGPSRVRKRKWCCAEPRAETVWGRWLQRDVRVSP